MCKPQVTPQTALIARGILSFLKRQFKQLEQNNNNRKQITLQMWFATQEPANHSAKFLLGEDPPPCYPSLLLPGVRARAVSMGRHSRRRRQDPGCRRQS